MTAIYPASGVPSTQDRGCYNLAVTRHRVCERAQSLCMKETATQIFAANVRKLMDSGLGPRTMAQLKEVSGLTSGTVSRLPHPENGPPKLDKIEKFAACYGLEAWQALFPGLDPASLPAPATLSPRALRLATAFDAASPDMQAMAYAVSLRILEGDGVPESAASLRAQVTAGS